MSMGHCSITIFPFQISMATDQREDSSDDKHPPPPTPLPRLSSPSSSGAPRFNTSDEVSALLLSELRQSSITAQGVRHAPGEVIGGDAGGEDAKLRAKVQWDLAVRQRRERTEALDACVEGSRSGHGRERVP